MHHHHVHKKESITTVSSSVLSIAFSIIASSHHWLHTVILFVVGSSTNTMVDMSGLLWIRRAMVLITFIMSIYSVYRLIKHKHMPLSMRVINALSVLISLGFILYTILNFGW